jgi:hypothetical protein
MRSPSNPLVAGVAALFGRDRVATKDAARSVPGEVVRSEVVSSRPLEALDGLLREASRLCEGGSRPRAICAPAQGPNTRAPSRRRGARPPRPLRARARRCTRCSRSSLWCRPTARCSR